MNNDSSNNSFLSGENNLGKHDRHSDSSSDEAAQDSKRTRQG